MDGPIDGRRGGSPAKGYSPQLAELAEAIGKKANATAVFGSPIVDGDRTVIPVAQACFGLGVGDGLIARGVGGGMTAKPLGFIVIDRTAVFNRPVAAHGLGGAWGVELGRGDIEAGVEAASVPEFGSA